MSILEIIRWTGMTTETVAAYLAKSDRYSKELGRKMLSELPFGATTARVLKVETLKDSLIKAIHPILDIGIEPTNDCNMDCSYCLRKERSIGYMDMNLFKSIVDQIPFFARVGLSFGGESILHPDFSKMVQYCQNRFRKLVVYSNGTLPYPSGIQVIRNPKPPKFIITRDFKVEASHAPPVISKYCKQLFKYMAILWNGDVTLCCSDCQGVKIIGNVKERTLKQIWNSEAYRLLRKKGFCDGCEVYKYI